MTPDLVLDALKGVADPDLRADIVSLKFVKDVRISDGRVAFTIELSSPSAVARDRVLERARAAVAGLPGVAGVDVTMAFAVRSVSAPEHGKPPLPGVKNVIAVGAGKGGVGKTTVAVNLAVALSKLGARVGMLDGDIYGPNVPIMFGLQARQNLPATSPPAAAPRPDAARLQ
jgi:ATP-binding protein involved in chromosome partitioning